MLADLERSGLTEKDALKLRFEPLTAQQVAKISDGQKTLAAYRIPYFGTDGKSTGFLRLRLMPSDPVPGDQRYWQAKNSLTHIYIPPVID